MLSLSQQQASSVPMIPSQGRGLGSGAKLIIGRLQTVTSRVVGRSLPAPAEQVVAENPMPGIVELR